MVMESKKLYENQVISSFLPDVFKKKHLSIQPKATQMLVDFLGNDLSRIENEVNKLALIVPANTEVTPDIIEENIGISKEFNNYELKSAFATNNKVKIARIIKYFAENIKDNNSLLGTLTVLYSFFEKLLIYHSLTDVSDKNVMATTKAAFYEVKDLRSAAQHYPMKKVSAIIAGLREIDVKCKGVGVARSAPAELLKELMMIMN